MANLNLTQTEVIALRSAVIDKYCKENNIKNNALENYKRELNGTITHYDKICYNITKYLEKQSNIEGYISAITESEMKTSISKWLAENEKNPKYTFSVSQWITANVLRKLLFDSQKFFETPGVNEISFKDYFIWGCYIYSGLDTNDVEKDLKASNIENKPEFDLGITTGPNTIDPYKINSKKFMLVPLSENDGKAREFEYAGEPLILNRSNIDPDNNTVTSKVQATIYLKEGEWHIKDYSTHKSTYIQVTGETKIVRGTVILLGNKYFLFQ